MKKQIFASQNFPLIKSMIIADKGNASTVELKDTCCNTAQRKRTTETTTEGNNLKEETDLGEKETPRNLLDQWRQTMNQQKKIEEKVHQEEIRSLESGP